jgi:glycosyltransferase involved in cell wall biosynthesis
MKKSNRKNLKDITVILRTLNEEKNIFDCIYSIKKSGIKNILVVDGKSQDNTIKIVKNLKVRYLISDRKGIAYQGYLGVKNVKTKYLAIIDADMRTTKKSFQLMMEDLQNSNYAGVEANIISGNKKNNYFDNAYQTIMDININKTGPRNMIGSPTLFLTKILKKNNFDPYFTGPSDDTDLAYRLSKKGYVFGGSSAKVKHMHRTSFVSFFKKYLWYGKGDAQFVSKHPERLLSILKHQLFNYPLKFSFFAFVKLKIIYIPFMFLAGYLRFSGMIFFLTQKKLGFEEKIYNT